MTQDAKAKLKTLVHKDDKHKHGWAESVYNFAHYAARLRTKLSNREQERHPSARAQYANKFSL